MKNLFNLLFLFFSLSSFAQIACDSLTFYGVEDDFTVYASAYSTSITVSGNWEGESVLLAEANENVVGVWNYNSTNSSTYESLTIFTMTMNTLCCDTYVWIGPTMTDGEWVIEIGNNEPTWICSPNGIGCYDVMDGSGEYATEEGCLASCDSIIYCNGYIENSEENGQLVVSVYNMTLPVIYEWSTGETTQTISPSLNGVYYCEITDADGCDYETTFTYFDFNFCDSTWYDADFTEVDGLWEVALTGYIAESLNDLTDTVSHTFTVTPSNSFMSQYGSAGSYPHFWSPEFALSLSTSDTLTICWSAALYADGLNAFPEGWSELCNMSGEQMLCDNWYWNDGAWARSAQTTVSIQESKLTKPNLLKVVDVLGREVNKDELNKLLFYIYDNGTIEKKYIIE